MDAQLKRGTIEVCVLAALIDGPSYGYKIVKDLENIMGLSESTLYLRNAMEDSENSIPLQVKVIRRYWIISMTLRNL